MKEYQDPFDEFNKNFGNEQSNQYIPKTILWQSYKDVLPGKWKQITREELKNEVNMLPKYMDTVVYYITQNGRDYYINEIYVNCVFYEHQYNNFRYMIGDVLMHEDSLYSDKDSATNYIKEKEAVNCGKITSIRYLSDDEMKAVGLPPRKKRK